MKKSLENVHVVIYSKKMLKQAVDRLKNLNQKVENPIFIDFECHGNDNLIFHDNIFKVVQDLPVNPCYEVTLNDLCEMVIDFNDTSSDIKEDGWYTHEQCTLFLAYIGDVGKDSEYRFGFDIEGEWFDKIVTKDDHYGGYKKADLNQVKQALIEEAKKRGFVNGVTIKSLITGGVEILSSNHYGFSPYPNYFNFGSKHIFADGKWAQIVEVDKFAYLKKAHAEGAIIQFKNRATDYKWLDCGGNHPYWEDHSEYRIKPEPKVKMGDYVITELKNQPSPGFSAYQLSIQNSVDVLNAEDTLYNFKVISKEKFEELRKVAFD